MKIYVVNLKRSVERRKAISAQLDALGLAYEIVDAVDGRDMTEEELVDIVDDVRQFTVSQAGCQLSHNKIYTLMQQQADTHALVLEDDALITDPSFGKLLQDLDIQLPENYITLLTYFWCREGNLLLRPFPGTRPMAYQQEYRLYKPNVVHGIARSGAYMLSKATAAALLAFQTPKLICQADSWVVYYDQKVISGVCCVYPMPVTENPKFGSEIGYAKTTLGKVAKWAVTQAVKLNVPFVSTYITGRREAFSQNSKKNIRIEV